MSESMEPGKVSLPLIQKRDELAARLYKERNNAGSFVQMVDSNKAAESFKAEGDHRKLLLTGISKQIGEASVVVWRADLFDAVVQGCHAFTDTKLPLNLIPTRPQWWPSEILAQSFAWRQQLKMIAEKNPDYKMQGIFVNGYFPSQEDWDESAERLTREGIPGRSRPVAPRAILQVRSIALVRGLPRVVCGAAAVDEKIPEFTLLYPVIAGLSFMAETFTEKKTFRYPSRFNGFRQKYNPVVYHIDLRARKEETVKGSQADLNKPSKEWQHCWKVRPHARRLAAPRKKDGKQVIWVETKALRGDPTKPLLPPRESIIRVRR